MGQGVYDQFAPKLPLFEVPVEEVSRIEAALGGGHPKVNLFFTAQTIALNTLTEAYYKLLDGPDGPGLLKKLGVDGRVFDRSKMPASPALASADTYADMW